VRIGLVGATVRRDRCVAVAAQHLDVAGRLLDERRYAGFTRAAIARAA